MIFHATVEEKKIIQYKRNVKPQKSFHRVNTYKTGIDLSTHISGRMEEMLLQSYKNLPNETVEE